MASNASVYAIKSELEQVNSVFITKRIFRMERCRQQVYVNKINECCQDTTVSVKYALLNYANMGICPHTESTNCPYFKSPSVYVHPESIPRYLMQNKQRGQERQHHQQPTTPTPSSQPSPRSSESLQPDTKSLSYSMTKRASKPIRTQKQASDHLPSLT